MNLADLYRQHRAELLSLYIVHVQRLGWYKSAWLHWQEKEQAKRYIELHAPVCLGSSEIVYLMLGEELLLKKHKFFFISPPRLWVGLKRSYKCKHDLTQNAFLTLSSVTAELKKSTININYNNSYSKQDLF